MSALPLPQPREIFLLSLRLNLYLLQELGMGLVFCKLLQLLTDIPALILGNGELVATLQGWVDLGAAQTQQHYASSQGHIARVG